MRSITAAQYLRCSLMAAVSCCSGSPLRASSFGEVPEDRSKQASLCKKGLLLFGCSLSGRKFYTLSGVQETMSLFLEKLYRPVFTAAMFSLGFLRLFCAIFSKTKILFLTKINNCEEYLCCPVIFVGQK